MLSTVDELTGVRADLMKALEDGRRTKPQYAARSQAMFDCWMQEQEEDLQPSHIARCREAFDIAFAELNKMEAMPEPEPMVEAAPAPAGDAVKAIGPFTVYFRI